jgi:hypothetical protein
MSPIESGGAWRERTIYQRRRCKDQKTPEGRVWKLKGSGRASHGNYNVGYNKIESIYNKLKSGDVCSLIGSSDTGTRLGAGILHALRWLDNEVTKSNPTAHARNLGLLPLPREYDRQA